MPDTDATTYGPLAPLRLLLIARPEEFDPLPVGESLSQRAWMVQQARRLVEANGGAGPPYLTAGERDRIRAVWLLNETRPPVISFSATAYREIRQTEGRLMMARP